MYKLLIVDDDAKTRNGLRRYVDWEALGVTEIQMAENARAALGLLEAFQCDIVLSDIRMRGMDGIDMCTALKARYPDCQIVFISAYSDKEYLKAAIELGAVCYVEKPIRPAEIVRAVEKAIFLMKRGGSQTKATVQAIAKEEQYLHSQLMFALAERTVCYDNFAQKVELSGLLNKEKPYMRMCILRTDRAEVNIPAFKEALGALIATCERREDATLYFDFKDNRNVVMLLSGSREEIGDEGLFLACLQKIAEREKIEGKRLCLAIGKLVSAPDALNRSYASARTTLKQLFTRDYGIALFPPEHQQPLPTEVHRNFMIEFEKSLALRDYAAMKSALAQLREQLIAHGAIFDIFIKNLYYSVELKLRMESNSLSYGLDEAAMQQDDTAVLDEMETLRQLHEHMVEQIDKFMEDSQKCDVDHSIVSRLLRMVQEDYADTSLSVNLLAARVYLTPTYLAGIFKQKTGKTLGQYITEVRIGKAKALLMDEKYKLFQIASMVGYSDPDYYTKVFKKHTGLTPSEYRKRVL